MNLRRFGHTTAERDAAIVERWKAGKTSGEIGAEFGMTRQRVCQIVKHVPLGGRSVRKKQRIKTVIALFDSGMSWIDVASKTGLSPATVAGYMHYAGRSMKK